MSISETKGKLKGDKEEKAVTYKVRGHRNVEREYRHLAEAKKRDKNHSGIIL